MVSSLKAILVLEDGRWFEGKSFGAEGETFGEIVFNTSMTGYQEILTDPSYAGQIVCMTYPLIGNYGVNDADVESRRPWVEGFVVRESSRIYSNWRATRSLGDYLQEYEIVGIEHIDTRALVRHIRDKGAMRAGISTIEGNPQALLEKILSTPPMQNRELAGTVTVSETYVYPADGEEKFHVVAYDFGVKANILRELARRGCRISVVPADTPAAEVLAINPDGIFLSNGPGDPAAMRRVAREVRLLAEAAKPVFGICLGHQLLGEAFGGRTFKLKFGHRGGNQPIRNLATGRVEITAHNHGFAVEADSLPPEIEITHINLNDNTIAGLRHLRLPVFSVQYHPESSPGPHDSGYLFDKFVEMMGSSRSKSIR